MGKYSIFLFISILFTFHMPGYAQADCSRILRDANFAFNQKQLRQALNLLQQTEICDVEGSLSPQRIQLQNKIFDAIEAQRNQANTARNNAAQAEKQALEDRDKANSQKLIADSLAQVATAALDQVKEADARNQKIVDASYFYKDQYALAFQNGKYGFINKEGDCKIDFKYDNATPFDEELGWALVKKGVREYYIDTAGNEYLLVRDIAYLDANVKALDLSNRGLTSIPEEVITNRKLYYLNLSGNRILKIPNLVNLKLDSLLHLDLSNNRLTDLPAEFGKLSKLKTINISNNFVKNLPDTYSDLTELDVLNLSSNQISQFPNVIVSLQKLTFLDISNNDLQSLPSAVGSLNSLLKLHLHNNQLNSIPGDICNLRNLEDLNLSFNLLTSLPEESNEWKRLKSLDISFNQINKLPADMEKLSYLRFFNCSGNLLTERPYLANHLDDSFLGSGNPFSKE